MIHIKTEKEITLMCRGGAILAEILNGVASFIKVGVSTNDLDNVASELMKKKNVRSAFLNYNGFPKNICVSINDEVVHGIPSPKKILKSGDIVSLDMGVILGGFHTDMAASYAVGGPKDQKSSELLAATKNSLNEGIKAAIIGGRVGDIGAAVQNAIKPFSFGIVKDLVGHGIGQSLHEEPAVPNFGSPGTGPLLKEGMVIAIEPMITVGDGHVILDKDNWTYRTHDGSWAAHFEHTVAITKTGPIILTE